MVIKTSAWYEQVETKAISYMSISQSFKHISFIRKVDILVFTNAENAAIFYMFYYNMELLTYFSLLL